MTEKKMIAIIYGTRPEFIKLAPILNILSNDASVNAHLISTGQHSDMVNPLYEAFKIQPDSILLDRGQYADFPAMGGAFFSLLNEKLESLNPDAVVVHGDTLSSAIAAQVSFYRKIPVVHVEAGLRSHDLEGPFPEEFNRRVVSLAASLHLAPSERARKNLLDEGTPSQSIVVTGNTVIDALKQLGHRTASHPLKNPELRIRKSSRLALISCHRRENWKNLPSVAAAVKELATQFPDWDFLLSVHSNPMVKDTFEPLKREFANVSTTPSLPYPEFIGLLRRTSIVMSDSGGLQEEASALGIPLLCLRDVTERPEVVDAGCVKLIGTETDSVVSSFTKLATSPEHYAAMSTAAHPYGSCGADIKSVAAIKSFLGLDNP